MLLRMKPNFLAKVSALCYLLNICQAQRGHMGMGMGPSRHLMNMMMSPMMMFEPRQSDLEKVLQGCLSKISETVDVVIDLKSWRPNSELVDDGSWWPVSWRHSPMSFYDVADFIDVFGKSIPKEMLYAVIVDGDAGNQTRYYLTAPVPPKQVAETTPTTTPAPVTGFTKSQINGGVMMSWWYQHSYSAPLERPLPTLRQLVMQALNARANNAAIEFPGKKNDTVPASTFTVVITDSSQKTPLSSLVPNKDRTIVLDIGGKFAANERNYVDRNILIVPESSLLSKFAPTVQFMLCQALGGYNGQQSEGKASSSLENAI